MKNKENYKKACQIAIDNDQDLVRLFKSTEPFYFVFVAEKEEFQPFSLSINRYRQNRKPSYTLKYVRRGVTTPLGEDINIYILDSVEEHIW